MTKPVCLFKFCVPVSPLLPKLQVQIRLKLDSYHLCLFSVSVWHFLKMLRNQRKNSYPTLLPFVKPVLRIITAVTNKLSTHFRPNVVETVAFRAGLERLL